MAQYKLTDSQRNLLEYVDRHQKAIFVGIISDLCNQLGEAVTPSTQFKLSDDFGTLDVINTENSADSDQTDKKRPLESDSKAAN